MMTFVKNLMAKGYLIEPGALKTDIVKNMVGIDEGLLTEIILECNPPKLITETFLTDNISFFIQKLNKYPKERVSQILTCLSKKYLIKEGGGSEKKEIKNFPSSGVDVIEDYETKTKKINVDDFTNYFRNRYNFFKNILQERGLDGLTSIGKIFGNRRNLSIIGLVYNKRYTKNRNLVLEVEDVTGRVNVVVNKEKKELFEKAESVVLDEVIAIKGSGSSEIIFANDIIFPDIGLRELKYAGEEEHAVFIADLHIGSSKFLEENFLKFISWLNGELGNETQKELSKKIKYLFIVGDLTDSVGVYPQQEKELKIKDLYEQYKYAAELLSKIRKDITIIICPGNHDAVRLLEPQPRFDPEIAQEIYKLENVVISTNPSIVNIGKTKDFPGFNVFMYHGRSLDYYMDQVDSLRLANAKMRPDLVLHFLFKKRHLGPTYACTTILPEKDLLALQTIPDIVVTAHVHRSAISTYNGILVISCSCFQSKTPYQEKLGHEPDPCKVCLFNLKTRKINVLDFS
ncbi:MAG: metallophosphoesterase [Candidatus Pacearchaeota archaeon]